MAKTFIDTQKDILRKRKFEYNSFMEMAKEWEDIVAHLEKSGYDDYLVEYDNDLSVRDQIEEIFDEEEIQHFAEWENFRNRVLDVDGRLKKLFMTDKERIDASNWWQKGVLKNGSGNYAEDMKMSMRNKGSK